MVTHILGENLRAALRRTSSTTPFSARFSHQTAHTHATDFRGLIR